MKINRSALISIEPYLRNRQLIIILLLIAAFLIRCFFFSGGIRGSDAYAYARHAYEIASGQYDLSAIQGFYGFRYFVLLPTALSFFFFGVNDMAASLFPLIFSLLNIVVVFLIAEKIFNRAIATLSSILLIIYPLHVMSANMLGPDSFIPFLSSSAILFYIWSEEKPKFISQQIVFLFLAGFLIALAYMSRVSSIFLFLGFALHQLYHKNYKGLIFTTVGLLTPLAAEALYFYFSTGDPFFEYHRITDLSMALMVKNDNPVGLLYYPKGMLGFDLTGLAIFGLIWWFVVGGLVWSFLKKDKNMLFIAMCLIIPFIGFEFGFQSLKEGILIVKSYNYLSLLTGPAMIIGAYFLYHLLQTLRFEIKTKSMIGFYCILLIIAMNLYGTYRLYGNVMNDAAPYIAVADYLKSRPGHIVYTHHMRWPLFLGYYLRYDPSYRFRDLNSTNESDLKKVSGAYAILSKRYIEADFIGRPISQDTYIARYAKSPPQGWTKVFSFSGIPPYNSVDLYYLQR